MSCAKMAEPIYLPFGLWSQMGPRKHKFNCNSQVAPMCLTTLCRDLCNKPVGFYGPIAPPVPNAPSSRICGQNLRNDADATFLDPHISVADCCCTLLQAGAENA